MVYFLWGELMIYKNKDIQTNINERTIDLGNINANFYTEDEGIASIRIFIRWNNQPLNLNTVDMSPTLSLFLADGSIFEGEQVDIVMADKGLIQYKIPDKVIKHVGSVQCKLFLKGSEEKIHVSNFYFNIIDSGVEGAIGKEIKIELLDDKVKKVILDNKDLFKGEKGVPGPMGSITGTTDWQKSKLTSDGGTLLYFFGVDLNNPELTLGEKTLFARLSSTVNSPTKQTSAYLKYLVRDKGYKRMEYSPIDSNKLFVRTQNNGVWTNWSESNIYPLTDEAGNYPILNNFDFNDIDTLSTGTYFLNVSKNNPFKNTSYGWISIYASKGSSKKAIATPFNSNEYFVNYKYNSAWLADWEKLPTSQEVSQLTTTVNLLNQQIIAMQSEIAKLKGDK